MTEPVLAAVAEIVGGEPVSAHGLGAGVYEVEFADGDLVVAKQGCGPGAARAEAASLEWLAESGAVPMPGLRGHDDRWLVMEQVEPGPSSTAAAEQLGRALAALHRAGANAFGAPPPGAPQRGWIGRAPMSYAPAEHWPRWYAEQRIEPYLRDAVDSASLSGAQAAVIAQVCERVEDLAGPAEPPARLHGDLWSGNVHWAADGRAWLIDPAAHGGHRETDLAMLYLFGCPHLEHVLGGYLEVAPLAEGWQRRISLHQLFPLLVHVVLFGGSYAEQAAAAARAALMG
ncbi:fructosamine kinase family protein [Kutzneria albida]|uniref:Fructosamine/Ketosamine-3-kinase n=1 Tax=Kutzneria albida DSM 43870 TaxID=1449976 RepID=W5W871_9PSEU|nr:Fructosamine/Ketosamine-3-kinase [Kutzneria albida DSM 43870]